MDDLTHSIVVVVIIFIFYIWLWIVKQYDKRRDLEKQLIEEREKAYRDKQEAVQEAIKKIKQETMDQTIKNEEEKKVIENAKKKLIEASEIFAEYYSDSAASMFDGTIYFLKYKRPPAYKTASEIKSIVSRGIKEKIKQYKQYEYIIKAYESMFPWLEDFKEIPLEQTFKNISDDEEDDEQIFQRYLSSTEREKLSRTEKFQRALNRYTESWDKNNWQIGLFYERYCGYMKEISGYKVKMNGAQKRWQDMGIDIIATKKKKLELIQCKYWSKDKTIYEKYIFQLFGTTVNYIVCELKKDNPLELIQRGIVKPVFITSTQLSDTAKRVAKVLNVVLLENYQLQKNYPKIKCNPSSEFGKIYHLPFDQQYDNFQVSQHQGAFYAETIEEAENLGFRRAYRWRNK